VEWVRALSDGEVGVVAPRPADPACAAELAALGAEPILHGRSAASAAIGVVAAGLSGRPLQEGLYAVGHARKRLAEALAAKDWDLVVIQLVRCAWAAEVAAEVAPGTPLLFDAIDAMGLHFRRSARGRPFPFGVPALLEARRCAARERWLASRSRLSVAVSRRDLEALGAPPGRARLVPVSAKERPDAGRPPSVPTVLLSGNLGYRPSVIAARSFARQVWPELRRRVPGARWVLAGARPARAVRALDRLAGVTVAADVADLGPFLADATVAIAPMATGSGVPMKVLEAWSARLPVIAHPWAAAGLEAEAGRDLLTASTAAEWVGQLERLLTEPAARAELAAAGHRAWESTYSPERVGEAIRSAVSEAVG